MCVCKVNLSPGLSRAFVTVGMEFGEPSTVRSARMESSPRSLGMEKEIASWMIGGGGEPFCELDGRREL